MEDSGEFGWDWGIYFVAGKSFGVKAAKTFTSDEQSSPILRVFTSPDRMESKKEVCENHGVKSAKGKE